MVAFNMLISDVHSLCLFELFVSDVFKSARPLGTFVAILFTYAFSALLHVSRSLIR